MAGDRQTRQMEKYLGKVGRLMGGWMSRRIVRKAKQIDERIDEWINKQSRQMYGQMNGLTGKAGRYMDG